MVDVSVGVGFSLVQLKHLHIGQLGGHNLGRLVLGIGLSLVVAQAGQAGGGFVLKDTCLLDLEQPGGVVDEVLVYHGGVRLDNFSCSLIQPQALEEERQYTACDSVLYIGWLPISRGDIHTNYYLFFIVSASFSPTFIKTRPGRPC